MSDEPNVRVVNGPLALTVPALAILFPIEGRPIVATSELSHAELERIIDGLDDDIAAFLGGVFERWSSVNTDATES